MADSSALPVRIGLLYDFPQMGDLLPRHSGSDSTKLPRPGGSTAGSSSSNGSRKGCRRARRPRCKRAFAELDDEGVVAIIGPSISDNALIAAPLCDEARIPAINYSGGERTRSRVDVPLPGRVARGGAARTRGESGRARARAASPSSSTTPRSVVATPSSSRPRADASVWRSPAPRASPRCPRTPTEPLARLRRAQPDVLVYLGLGVSSRAVALGLASLGWSVPVLANSALMFGYARPDWRDGYAGWEYIDTIADDNLQPRDARASSSPQPPAVRSAAPRTTWGACSEKASPPPST